MARGNSRANSEQAGSPEDFKKTVAQGASGQGGKLVQTEKGYRAELIEHFKDLVKENMSPGEILAEIPDNDLEGIAESVAGESSDTRDQRDEFDRIVEKAEKAISGRTPFDGADKEQISEFIPLTLSEVQEGLSQRDVLDREWEAQETSAGLEAAQAQDKRYPYNDGSFEESFMAKWAAGFIQARLDSASADRDDYDDEINTIEAQSLEDNVNEWSDNR